MGGLGALAEAIAESTGGSITIEDTRFRVLAHSATRPEADRVRRSTILGGRVPQWRIAELRRSGILRALWTSRDVIRRPAEGDSPERLVIAVRSGPEVLGSIWVAADGRSLSRWPRTPCGCRRGRRPHLVQHRLRESGPCGAGIMHCGACCTGRVTSARTRGRWASPRTRRAPW
ncbi:hypothetical protein NKH18_46435 [Streptomyces sp. M10(2022)]